MELPHIGSHCKQTDCRKLDFLPLKCDACMNFFCGDHVRYVQHNCAEGKQKDVQIPICPLCNEPVPTAPFTSPDITVGNHIDQYCKSEKKKIYTNRCSHNGCKRKELIPVKCSDCQLNYCLRHRHVADHKCQGRRNLALDAAEKRRQHGKNSFEKIQGNLTEDEALSRAIALSIGEFEDSRNNKPPSSSNSQNQSKDKCKIF